MTRAVHLVASAVAMMLLVCAPAMSQTTEPNLPEMRIGYVELTSDARYDEDRVYARIQMQPGGRPYVAAELALADAAAIGRVIKTKLVLERAVEDSVDAIASKLEAWIAERNIHFVVVDLPADAISVLADRTKGKDLVLFNTTAVADSLRAEHCQSHLLHTMASQSVQMDALAQYLAYKRWKSILVLQGPLPDDTAMVQAFRRATQKFGLQIIESKPFLVTNDPRHREQSNIALITGGSNYDVVFLADNDGEFGRYVPYNTLLARPIVGSTGLVPEVWHWSWERNGGPQVNSRFERVAHRRMTGSDWATWVAVKAVTQAVLRTRSTEFAQIRDYLLSDKLNLDGSKGNPMSFRAWDRQLRQPMLLTTHNAVIERAPISGFMHQLNELDTLGFDAPETRCRF